MESYISFPRLHADNEQTELFGRNAVVDIYDIRKGEYGGTFYIPYYKRKKTG